MHRASEAVLSMSAATSAGASAGTSTPGIDAIDNGAGKAQQSQGISLSTFFASLAGGLAIFGVELLLFLIIKGKFSRI